MMRPLLSASQTEEKRKLEELRRALIAKAKNQKNSGCRTQKKEKQKTQMASHTEEGEAGHIEKTESLAEEEQEQMGSSIPRMQKENETYALEKKYKIGHL
jgi:hypothetical protein